MKFRVKIVDEGFEVAIQVDPLVHVRICEAHNDIDEYVAEFPKPWIQILPNGKEKVICE